MSQLSQLADTSVKEGKTRPAPKSIDVLDFLTRNIPPRRWLVEGLIQERDITMLHAWRGVGKTHFVLHLAWAVASGTAFLRYTVPQPAGVLLVDGEMPQEDLQSRLSACLSSYNAPEAPLQLLCADARPNGIPSLATSEGQALIERELDALPDVRLLILDSVSTLCNGGPAENEAESWTAMQNWLLKLRRRGVSPLIVHHDGKGGKQRGTSKREDVISQSIHLKRPDDYNPVQGARFQVILEKARGVYGSDAEPFEARLVDGPDGSVTWELEGVEIASPDKLLDLLQSGVPMRDAFPQAGVSRPTAFRLQKEWRKEGKLSPGKGRKSKGK